ncbi:MAG: UTP--glucose-1-phosphate uridylyltransferase, partial [Lentisphaeria bacterium]|nr:UTP--glucose-1-phosphate uridylyltransferase [Lentisphaeria bacterium]
FTPGIFEELENTPPGKGGEIQLTDAMKSLLKKEKMFTRIIDGKRYDLGSKTGFLKSTFEFALAREEFRQEMIEFFREKLSELENKD